MKSQSQLTPTPNLYIGMDIHKKNWAVHLRTDISMYIPDQTDPHSGVN